MLLEDIILIHMFKYLINFRAFLVTQPRVAIPLFLC